LRGKIIDKIYNELNNFTGVCKVSVNYAQKLCGLLQCSHYVSKSVFVQHISGQIAQVQSINSNNGILINFNKLTYLSKLIIREEKWQSLSNIGTVFVDSSDYDCGVCFLDGVIETIWCYKGNFICR